MATAITPPRARPASVSTGRAPQRWTTPANVGDIERWASVLGGGALTAYGLSRGSLSGLALALVGGGLAYRGLSGHCPVYGTLGLSTAGPTGPAASVAAGAGVKVEK